MLSLEESFKTYFKFIIKWKNNNSCNRFWEEGHNVIGVECADEAINDFFSLNKIPFTSFKSFDSIDGNIFQVWVWGLSKNNFNELV
jgi:hypothetical protein